MFTNYIIVDVKSSAHGVVCSVWTATPRRFRSEKTNYSTFTLVSFYLKVMENRWVAILPSITVYVMSGIKVPFLHIC